MELIVFYEGQERDQYLTMFGALSAEYEVNENLKLTGVISAYNTQEEEFFDIEASCNLGEVDTNIGSQTFGDVTFAQGIGSQLNHSRNELDALITNIQIRGTYKKDEDQIDFAIKYQNEDIRDRIREFEVIDSLGFSIRPPSGINLILHLQDLLLLFKAFVEKTNLPQIVLWDLCNLVAVDLLVTTKFGGTLEFVDMLGP